MAKKNDTQEEQDAVPAVRVIQVSDLAAAQAKAEADPAFKTEALALFNEYRAIAGDTDFIINLMRSIN